MGLDKMGTKAHDVIIWKLNNKKFKDINRNAKIV